MHTADPEDLEFRRAFEACEVPPAQFDHAAHVRLAYIYLTERNLDDAASRMKHALLSFLAHLGIGDGKYHETVTQAWTMAVHHFMQKSAACRSSLEFIRINPELLDSKIMLTHYSAEVLFSPTARAKFVAPDIQAIPDEPH